jgi:hypothetical protein
MTTYDDNRLASRFAALAPDPLPGDWADVLCRSGVAQEKPWRLGRLGAFRGRRRRRLLVFAAATLVVVVATASALAVRAFIVDRGFIGVPPEGATPSTPESGELVLQWWGRSATVAGAPKTRVWVYADGRIIWSQNGSRSGQIPEGANELSSGYLEQRLTPDGVEILRSEVVGLLDRSRALLETFSPKDVWDDGRGLPGRLALFVPGDSGVGGASVEVRDGDRFLHLRSEQIGGAPGSEEFRRHLDDERNYLDGTIATPEQVSDLRRIDALVTDPASVLPPSAWAVREIRAYVPSYYEVCIDSSPPKDASQLLSSLPTRAADVLRDKSRTRSEGGFEAQTDNGPVELPGRSVRYCSKLTTEEARVVADGLSGLGQDSRWNTNRFHLAYRVAEGAHDWEGTSIWFEPYFPNGRFTRSDSG